MPGGWRKPEERDRIQTARRPPEPRDIMPDKIRDARKNSKEFWLAQFRDRRGEGWRERKVAGLKPVFEPKEGCLGATFCGLRRGGLGAGSPSPMKAEGFSTATSPELGRAAEACSKPPLVEPWQGWRALGSRGEVNRE